MQADRKQGVRKKGFKEDEYTPTHCCEAQQSRPGREKGSAAPGAGGARGAGGAGQLEQKAEAAESLVSSVLDTCTPKSKGRVSRPRELEAVAQGKRGTRGSKDWGRPGAETRVWGAVL